MATRHCLKIWSTRSEVLRGSWCPYCNIDYARTSRDWARFGNGEPSSLPSRQRSRIFQGLFTKEQIELPIRSDFKTVVAQRFGLQFVVDNVLQKLMKEFGNSLREKNGDDSWTLPVPGTFVTSSTGRVEYGFTNTVGTPFPSTVLRADSCKKRKGWGALSGNGARKIVKGWTPAASLIV